jgi:GNAT superfamily N-acetyltransferase
MWAMAWFLSDSLAEYSAAAGGLLRGRPAHNTILLSVAETLRARGLGAFGDASPLFGWWTEPGGEVTAAFLHTPPFPVALTSMPDDRAAALARLLAGHRRGLGGVNGDTAPAAAFAAAWQEQTGDPVTLHMRSRLYRLDRLCPPGPPPPGQARVAGAADRDLLIEWYYAFHADAHAGGPLDGGAGVDDRLSYGGLTLWQDGGGPVSMAGLSRLAAGQARVGPVYTPPEQRGRGYGGAVTTAVSQAALDAGAAEVVLFTDLANPTSNGLYLRLGYRGVSDRAIYSFGS